MTYNVLSGTLYSTIHRQFNNSQCVLYGTFHIRLKALRNGTLHKSWHVDSVVAVRSSPICWIHSWIQQIGDGTPFSIRAEWSKARRRGHSGLTQRTSAVYAI